MMVSNIHNYINHTDKELKLQPLSLRSKYLVCTTPAK